MKRLFTICFSLFMVGCLIGETGRFENRGRGKPARAAEVVIERHTGHPITMGAEGTDWGWEVTNGTHFYVAKIDIKDVVINVGSNRVNLFRLIQNKKRRVYPFDERIVTVEDGIEDVRLKNKFTIDWTKAKKENDAGRKISVTDTNIVKPRAVDLAPVVP